MKMTTSVDKVLISVIVPVYNAENYLSKCVDSILNQGHERIEVLLIDDGSTDSSSEICDRYARQDSRVKVIHKKNGGVSDTRNVGVKNANGEYIAFVDSDDYVDKNFLQILLSQAVDNNADISVCNFNLIYPNGKNIHSHPNVELKNFTNIEAMRDVFLYPSMCGNILWNKLYKRELFIKNNVEFPNGKIHEDNFTIYKLFYYANRVSYVSKRPYYYVQRSGSIMHRKFNREYADMIESSKEAEDWVIGHNLPLVEEVMAYRLTTAINLINTMIDRKGIDKSIWLQVAAWIRLNKNVISDNKFVTNQQKAALRILFFGTITYRIFRTLYTARRIKV